LVPDDSAAIVALLHDLLTAAGGRVSASAALPDPAARPDLTVLDVLFGGRHLGLQTLQQPRLDRETGDSPILICSAATEALRHRTGRDLGKGTGLVPKPVDVDELLAETASLWTSAAGRSAQHRGIGGGTWVKNERRSRPSSRASRRRSPRQRAAGSARDR